jgi:hypothetical protein
VSGGDGLIAALADDSLASALARVQASVGPIPKTKTAKVKMKSGGEYSYSYADLGDVLAVVRPLLAAEGIAIVQGPDVHEGQTVLVTSLLRGSERETWRMLLPMQGLDAQAVGSLITYWRRYALCAAVGVAAEDDDDGRAAKDGKASKRQRPAPEGAGRSEQRSSSPKANADGEPLAAKHQTAQFTALAEHLELDRQDRADYVLAEVGRSAWKDVTKADADHLIAGLKGDKLDMFEAGDGSWRVITAGSEPAFMEPTDA